jgi:hypothetical protein
MSRRSYVPDRGDIVCCNSIHRRVASRPGRDQRWFFPLLTTIALAG